MIKYAKITNQETKQCEVGIGTNTEFYKSIGMTEIEVEQSYDGSWYVKGYAPEEPETEIQYRIREIRDNLLEQTDKYMIVDFPISDEERQQFIAYRKYLRDYTEQKDWWEMLPMNFENWCETLNKMVEKTTEILTEQEQTEEKE